MLRLALALLCLCALPLAASSTVITGKLTGTDGKPLEIAHVHIAENMFAPPLQTVAVGKDGVYRIETDNTSPFLLLQFTGGSHKIETVPMLFKQAETVELDVRLQPNTASKNLAGVTVISDLNNYDFSSGTALQKQPDGTYTGEFTTDKSTFTYQVIIDDGSGGARSVNGTMYDQLMYDGGGDYRSVVTVKNGTVKIVFDPEKMPATAAPAVVQFAPKSKHHEKFSLGASANESFRSKIMMMAQTARTEEEAKVPGQELKRRLEEMAASIGKEQDAEARQYLLLFYLDIVRMTELSREKPDPVVERAFREIAPESLLWDYEPSLHYAMTFVADMEKVGEYEKAMLEANVSPKVRRSVIMALMSNGLNGGDEKEGRKYYDMLLDEFPESQEADYARQEFNPNRAVKKGNRVPEFSVASLDGSATYSSETMKGRYYLIDFWATWCGPCVKEMGHLHEVYEKYKGSNFEILSLSFDGKPEDIAKFRDKKWAMPWLHTFVKGGFNSELGKAFEVNGIPKPVLVDPNGVIVAAQEELRGDRLEQTLAKFLEPVASGNDK